MSTEKAEQLAKKLIEVVEQSANAELLDLRRRINEVINYMQYVTTPNLVTLWHINHILTQDTGKIYSVPESTDYLLTTQEAARPWHVKAQPSSGPLKLHYCLVSGHDTQEEAEWMVERLWLLFGVAARVEERNNARHSDGN